MFSKSRINELNNPTGNTPEKRSPMAGATPGSAAPAAPTTAGSANKPKPAASVLSADLVVTGNLKTSGDIQIEGTVKGDIHAHLLTVGEKATVSGEIVGDDVVVTGRIQGRVRGLKVRLTSTARVEGDIVHKSLAIESGAYFEGSVIRQDDPLSGAGGKKANAPSVPPAQKLAAAPVARPHVVKPAAGQ